MIDLFSSSSVAQLGCTTRHFLETLFPLSLAQVFAEPATAGGSYCRAYQKTFVGWKRVLRARGGRAACVMPRRRYAAMLRLPLRRNVRPRLAQSADAGSSALVDAQSAPSPAARAVRGLHEAEAAASEYSGQVRHREVPRVQNQCAMLWLSVLVLDQW